MERERKITWTVVITLMILGGTCIGLRVKALGRSRSLFADDLWRLTYDIELANPPQGKIIVALPENGPYVRLFRESFSHPGLWVDIQRHKSSTGREAVIAPAPGYKSTRFSAEFSLQHHRRRQPQQGSAKAFVSAEELKRWLRAEPQIQFESVVVAKQAEELTSQATTKKEALDRIFEFCSDNLMTDPHMEIRDAEATLRTKRASPLGQARAMVALCRACQIPARLVTGVQLKSQTRVTLHHWVEAYLKKQWHAMDPVYGYAGSLPSDYLPLVRGFAQPVRPAEASATPAVYTLRRIFPVPHLIPTAGLRHWTNILDLTRVGPGMQAVLIGLLLLPYGALITALFRNLVGVQTFGTFAPSLIALSLMETDAVIAVVLLGLILVVGLGSRIVLNRLKLLMVARLGVILIVVVITMITAISVLDYRGMIPSASATLVPMIILTMLIERFHVTAEQDGTLYALRILLGTLLTAAACWVLLTQRILSQFVIHFPESLLLVAAALIWVGRYTGYRLSECWRFRDLTHPPS